MLNKRVDAQRNYNYFLSRVRKTRSDPSDSDELGPLNKYELDFGSLCLDKDEGLAEGLGLGGMGGFDEFLSRPAFCVEA